jgi:hypothetical protein
VKRHNGLLVGGLGCAIGVLAVSTPAQAVVQCTGNSSFGSAAAGSGANCGFLGEGGTFELDVTSFFAGLGTNSFDLTQFGIGVITSGQSQVAFSNVKAVVTGMAGMIPFTASPIAIWGDDLGPAPSGLGDPAPFGSALTSYSYTPSFSYTPSNGPVAPFDAFREISFAFNNTGIGGFGSWKASPDAIGLTSVTSFIITGRLDSVGTGDPSATNIISFAAGPGGIPTAGSTVGGFFTTQVPGPLPVAGAAAAFAWSRRLRRKQKAGAGL